MPNIVIVFIDDMGWGDLACYGGKTPTPHFDRLAQEGVRFSDFYVAQPVCSASRAALLTGCYPNRVGIAGALNPNAKNGLSPDETTIAEICKRRGYATAIYGKWHLGHTPNLLPTAQGFDEYYGIPYSNDMWPRHPTSPRAYRELPVLEGVREVIPAVTADDQKRFTREFTERAVSFIDRHAAAPFFLYVPHVMVHVPLYAGEGFAGKSGRGLYADVVTELDWSMGEILGALDRNGIADDTLVIVASDNGPWLPYGEHAGSPGPLREGKGTVFEGGVREPGLWRWPGHLPAGAVYGRPAMTIDVLPTVAAILGVDPTDGGTRKIDGVDLSAHLFTHDPHALPNVTADPHEALFFYYDGNRLEAVRSGRWKLHFPHPYVSLAGAPGGKDGRPAPQKTLNTGLELYDLETDIGEKSDLAAARPDIVQRLGAMADRMRADLGDLSTGRKPTGARPAGVAEGSTSQPVR